MSVKVRGAYVYAALSCTEIPTAMANGYVSVVGVDTEPLSLLGPVCYYNASVDIAIFKVP